jgi:hypothetical protein
MAIVAVVEIHKGPYKSGFLLNISGPRELDEGRNGVRAKNNRSVTSVVVISNDSWRNVIHDAGDNKCGVVVILKGYSAPLTI